MGGSASFAVVRSTQSRPNKRSALDKKRWPRTSPTTLLLHFYYVGMALFVTAPLVIDGLRHRSHGEGVRFTCRELVVTLAIDGRIEAVEVT